MTAAPVVEKKRRFPWGRKKKTEMEEKRIHSWEELGSAILTDQSFTDGQAGFLAFLLQEQVLSIREMQEVADNRLSLERMRLLSSLFYARHGRELKLPPNPSEDKSEIEKKEEKIEPSTEGGADPEASGGNETVYVDVSSFSSASSHSDTGTAERLLKMTRMIGGKSHAR